MFLNDFKLRDNLRSNYSLWAQICCELYLFPKPNSRRTSACLFHAVLSGTTLNLGWHGIILSGVCVLFPSPKVSICLECNSSKLRGLKRKWIRCSAQATVLHLKKFIAKKLNLTSFNEVRHTRVEAIDFMCVCVCILQFIFLSLLL